MEYQKVSSPTLSKKLTNGYSFSGKSIYDGVFGCPRKVGSLVEEDYGVIFGGSSSCSIPILDVPELNERKVSVDVNSSTVDYSKIFGGYGVFDFAVSHEELSAKPKEKDSFIEEAQTPAETGSHTSNFSVENRVLSHKASYQSSDGVKQSKMSCHKTKQGGKNETKGTTRIAQFRAVPGYTCLNDEVAPSQMTEGDKPFSSVSNDTYHNSSFSGEIMEGKLSRKAMSTHPLGTARKQASRDGVKSKNKSNRSRSNSNDILFDAYEIDFVPHPSKVPPLSTRLHNTGNNMGDSKISMTSKFGVSKSHSSEDAADICSSPYFEEEIDANSVAAASAAAVKKAIEEAQAKIRIAKEIMERKKEGFQNHVKVRLNNSLKSEKRRESKIADKVNKFREEASEKYEKVNIPMPVGGPGTQNAMKAGQVAPDLRERDNLFFAKGASGEMLRNKNKITPVDHRQEEMNDRMQSVNECELKEESCIMKSLKMPEENGEKLELVEEASKQEETERKLNIAEGTFKMEECADEPKSVQEGHDHEEYGKKLRASEQLEEIVVMSKASNEIEASKKKLRMFQEPSENEKKQEMQESNNIQQEWLENEQKQKEVFKQENNDTTSEYVPEREENEVGPCEIFDHNENGKGDKAACERVEFETQQKEPCTMGENEIGLKDVHPRDHSEKTSDKAEEQEKVQVRMYDLHYGEKIVKKLDEDGEFGGREKLIGAEENVKTLDKAYEMIETESSQKQSCERTESEQMQAGIDQGAEDEESEVTQEALEHCKNNLETDNNVCKRDEIEILNENMEASGHEENKVCLEIPEHEENGEVMEVTHRSSESKEMETESNAVEVANELDEKQLSEVEIGGSAQVVLEFSEIKTQVKDTTEALAFEYNSVNLGTTDMDVPGKQNDLHGKESRTVCNAGNHIEESACESEEIFEDAEEVDIAMEQEEDETNFEFLHEETWVDNGKNVEATKLPSIFEVEGETTETSNTIKISPNTERNEDIYSKTLEPKEMKAQASMQKEGELEKGNVRKIDEIKEKEREREKERIAVERAIREARERAFTEARERAERAAAEKANTEVRRRAMAEARERSEKASAETNDRSSADRTFLEARLKAERAAVERATAEARERALEKAMSEKAALAARKQAVKSSGASRDNGMRQSFASNDSQYRGSGPTRSSGHPNSSNVSVPCSNDKFGVNDESILRDKASLERHNRTAERAAKALAEKNMRDLLAQKEQAERNRLAEALDADVKRWSSGKAGNLRALLSTLQYILGPDSGWQPIPLTELVATTAVKKAYRKATLFVHPDKLQQRGASIQQKYTCEKVFDLLKDAWNKSSAEER